jgi:hypothetical protein
MKQKLHGDLNTLLNFYRKNREDRPEEFTHKTGLISKPGFFSLSDFQQHLNNPLLKPEWIHIKRNGKSISTDTSLHSKNVQMRHLHFMDKEVINQEIEKGAALVLEGIDILDPGINAFCAMLEKGLPCGMANSVVFFSQKDNEAYEPHADTNDVIVVQLEGRKTWHLYERRQRAYLGAADLSNEQLGPVKYQITLRPGDALYVRTGVPHHCVTDTSYSLHMSFDLLDRTPEPPLFTGEANHQYNFACADAYVPASEVVDKYIEILKSPKFQDEVIKETASIRSKIEKFRETVSRASGVRSLSKLK